VGVLGGVFFCAEGKGRTQTTSSLGEMRLFFRIASRTALPSLPVALVRAIIFWGAFSVLGFGCFVWYR
jgi:hypothetical protein